MATNELFWNITLLRLFYSFRTGISQKLKEYNPDIKIIGIDPEGSILAVPDSLNDRKRLESYQVEGIGYDFIPDVLDRSIVDEWHKSEDTSSLVMMRRLIRDEGILCGGSSGAAVSCALKVARTLRKGQRCVIILPDSVRNYMTKSLSDDWMIDHGFVDGNVIKPKKFQTWWANKRVCDIPMATPLTITSRVTCKAAIALLKREGFDMVPVIGIDGNIIGVVTEGNMTSKIISGRVKPEQTVEDAKVIYKAFHKFCLNDSLADLARALDHDPYALVITEQRCFTGSNFANGTTDDKGTPVVVTKTVVSGIVTRIDLLDYVSTGENQEITSSSNGH